MSTKPTSKKFGKSTREVPAAADKAKKWYNADDESEPKQVSFGDDRKVTMMASRQQDIFWGKHISYTMESTATLFQHWRQTRERPLLQS